MCVWLDDYCRRKPIPSVPNQLKEINAVNGADTPQLDQSQVRASFSQFKRLRGQAAASIAAVGVGSDDGEAASADKAETPACAKLLRGRMPKAVVAAQRQQSFTCGARTAPQHVMDGGDAVGFVTAIYDVAEDMEADDVMCNCLAKILTVSIGCWHCPTPNLIN